MTPFPPWTVHEEESPLIAVALHAGHDVRPEVDARLRLSSDARLREEDPHTDTVARALPTWAVLHRSRFEVDMNRSREECVYRGPDEAWGLDVWKEPPDQALIERSRALYDEFHERVRGLIERALHRHGLCVVYDVHSYNHRRGGPDAPPDDPALNPELNLGTGAIPGERWADIVGSFTEAVRARGTDIRENVRFRGGHFPHWVAEKWPRQGCPLAIELKKTYMDEWTGRVDPRRLQRITATISRTYLPVIRAIARRQRGYDLTERERRRFARLRIRRTRRLLEPGARDEP